MKIAAVGGLMFELAPASKNFRKIDAILVKL